MVRFTFSKKEETLHAAAEWLLRQRSGIRG